MGLWSLGPGIERNGLQFFPGVKAFTWMSLKSSIIGSSQGLSVTLSSHDLKWIITLRGIRAQR